MRIVTLSFPVDSKCIDPWCPVNEYGEHSHTSYNVYDVPEAVYVTDMHEITAAEVSISSRLNESAPANNTKGALQNV